MKRFVALMMVLSLGMSVAGCFLIRPLEVAFSLSPVSGYPPLSVTFDATATESPNGIVASCTWDFGDGTTGSGCVTEHVYAEKGSFIVRLTVRDDSGRQGTATGTVQALNRIPHAEFTFSPHQPPRDHPVRFDASRCFDDDGEIVSYRWDFDDGTTAEGIVVEHVFPAQRVEYTVVLTVTDNDGTENSTARIVEPIGCDTCDDGWTPSSLRELALRLL